MAFLGLDIAKEKVDCCLLTENGKKNKRHVIQQSSAGFKDLQKWIKEQGFSLNAITTVLEPTGVYGYKLTRWLHDQKASVKLVQPTQARYFARYHKVNSKNDEIDSLMLAKMGKEKSDELPEWKPLSQLYETIQFLLRRMDQVVRTRQVERNRLEGHEGIKSFETADKYTKLTVEFYDKQEAQITKEIVNLIATDPKLDADVRLLKTIPGIGDKTSPILAILLNTRDFKSASQFAKFVGVIPKDNKSGSSVASPSRMSKAGSSALRAKLYMGASAAMREDTRDSRLKRFYQELMKRGKSEGSAHGALMHKMVVVAYGVWKSQKPYDDDYEKRRLQNTVQQATKSDADIVECEAVANAAVDAADSPCSECKRALRPSRTRSEEHKQAEGVKAAQAKHSAPRRGCLDSEDACVTTSEARTRSAKRRTRTVDG